MLRSELLEILANGESSSIEFKRDDVRPEQLAREVVAMMNLRGGRVLLGVEDDGQVSGLARPDVEEWVMNIFADKVHPSVLPHYEEISVEDGKRVAVVSFVEGAGKPYALRHAGREEIFVRRGSTNRPASREEVIRLAASGGLLHPEKMPVSGAPFGAFDAARVEEYVAAVLQDPDVPTTETAWIERLVQLGLMVRTETVGPVATIAGLVLFGAQPRRYLSQAGARVLAFAGSDKTYEALLDRALDGPLVGRVVRGADGIEERETGLMARVVEELREHLEQQAPEPDASLARPRTWRYPLAAVRELVVNAFSHRDWTRTVDVEIASYADRLEIVSPGGLPNTMTVDQMLAGQRSPRNPIIHSVLRDYGLSDSRGMGIRAKVVPQLRASSGRDPLFEVTDDQVRVVAFSSRLTP